VAIHHQEIKEQKFHCRRVKMPSVVVKSQHLLSQLSPVPSLILKRGVAIHHQEIKEQKFHCRRVKMLSVVVKFQHLAELFLFPLSLQERG
jgi:hypothetical protein